MYAGLRNDKVYQSITEYKPDELGAASGRKSELPAGQAQNGEIESHGVYKASGEDLVISVRDDTSALDPGSLEKNS